MRIAGRACAFLAATLPMVVLAPSAAAAAAATVDVDALSGRATGVEITGVLGTIPPTPTVSLSANEGSPATALGPFPASAPSVLLPGGSLPFAIFSAGPLTVTTSAGRLQGEDEGGFVSATAVVRNPVLGPNAAVATSIIGSCRIDGPTVNGTTVIEGGLLFGQPFPPTPTPAPNTVVPVPGIGTVTLNKQQLSSSLSPSGATTRRIVVTAVHASFSGAGGILPMEQNAEAFIGQVVCESMTSTTPPSATTTAPSTTTSTTTITTVPPSRPGGALPDTGASNLLPLGMAAMGLGALLRRSLKPR